MSRHICIDLGATSGRVMEVEFREGVINLREQGRFLTRGDYLPYDGGIRLLWDIPRFWKDILEILEKTEKAETIAVDGWGVDFALLDSKGNLLRLPHHYRDKEHLEIYREVVERIGEEKIYNLTGIQLMPINTLFQIYSLKKNTPYLLEHTHRLLMLPDLFTYFLSGESICEYTEATTTQMYSVEEDNWATGLLEELSLPTHYLLPVVKPGEVVGEVRKELNILRGTRVVATASHDTASAIFAIPMEEDSVYISSGTWSLVGIKINKPIINEKTRKYNFTNEGGAGCITFLKNITGMWIFEECRREWGKSIEELLSLEGVKTNSFIDVDDSRFQTPGNMTEKIRGFLRETSQDLPSNEKEVVRIILESLAFKYRWVIDKLEEITGIKFKNVHIVGGGAKNQFLNQLTADVTRKEVVAGPYEATTIGNALLQMMAIEIIGGWNEGKELVKKSFPLRSYTPRESEELERRYLSYTRMMEDKDEFARKS